MFPVWEAERTPPTELARVLGPVFTRLQVDASDLANYAINVFWGMKRQDEPLLPAAVDVLRQRAGHPSPTAHCLPAGLPAALFVYGFKIVQSPREVVVLMEDGDPSREIYTDGRALPIDPAPSWMGHSVGIWKGDTLTVDTTGFTEYSWLDAIGHPRGESMHVREQYRRRDFGHMDLEITIDDAKYYSKPISLKTALHLVSSGDYLEFVCGENEKDRVHMTQR